MLGSNTNLVTTVIGFGMSATFIVFVCTRIICGRIRGRSFESQNMFEIESRTDIEQPEHHANRPEPVLVTAIPTMKFNQEAFSSIEDTQCVICLAEYKERDLLRIMPKCGHSFHLSCIDMWLRKQSTCPVCRVPLQSSSETKHVRPVTFSMGYNESQTSERRGGDQRHFESVPGSPLQPAYAEPVTFSMGNDDEFQTSERGGSDPRPFESVPGSPVQPTSAEPVTFSMGHGDESQTSERRSSDQNHFESAAGSPLQPASAEPETRQ